MEDYYATLQVRPTATAEEIERAYRRLARANHPDLLRDATPLARQRAEEILKGINRAHRILGDRERRRDYDRQRRGSAAAVSRQRRPPTPRSSPAPTPPPAERTAHWGSGGPIDIEWTTPPPRAPRPETDLFSLGRLIRYAAVIIVFTALLVILWRPGFGQRAQPAPTVSLPTPTAIATPATPRPATDP